LAASISAGVIADGAGAAARSGEAKQAAATAPDALSRSRLESLIFVIVSSRYEDETPPRHTPNSLL
jgi:hypothetical protein